MSPSVLFVVLNLMFCGYGFAQTLDQCETVKGDSRSSPGSMNDNPGTSINIFPEIKANISGRVVNISYYAVRTGTVFVSFWKPTLEEREFRLITTIFIDVATAGTVTNIGLTDQFYWVQNGSMLAVHYNRTGEGCIDYEKSDLGSLTPDVQTYGVWNDNSQQNWNPGDTVILAENAFKNYDKAVALHVELCGCVNCLNNACDSSDGRCLSNCIAGYKGPFCYLECDAGTYGESCMNNCSRNCVNGCDRVTGNCTDGCLPGYYLPMCNQPCAPGHFGDNCMGDCSGNCLDEVPCNFTTGNCDNGCKAGYYETDNCTSGCEEGTYGVNCMYNCSGNCADGEHCDTVTGHCSIGCLTGYNPPMCSDRCDREHYGDNCASECHCSVSCVENDGYCHGECQSGWEGGRCADRIEDSKESSGDDGGKGGMIAGIVILFFITIIAILFISFLVWKRLRRTPKEKYIKKKKVPTATLR